MARAKLPTIPLSTREENRIVLIRAISASRRTTRCIDHTHYIDTTFPFLLVFSAHDLFVPINQPWPINDRHSFHDYTSFWTYYTYQALCAFFRWLV